MRKKKTFQPIVNTNLTFDEFADLHTLVRLQSTTVTALVGELIRKELNKRQFIIRLNNAAPLLEKESVSSPSPAAAPPPEPTLPFTSLR